MTNRDGWNGLHMIPKSGVVSRVTFTDGTDPIEAPSDWVTFNGAGVSVAVSPGREEAAGDRWFPTHRVHEVEVVEAK